jgi:hypothetical protein
MLHRRRSTVSHILRTPTPAFTSFTRTHRHKPWLAYNEKMHASSLRFVAVDWSGAKAQAEQRRRIVVADWREGSITLSADRTREETTQWLIQQSLATPRMVVGLDFSFSLPLWFVKEKDATSIEHFWQVAADNAEQWLQACDSPFWGRPGRRCPDGHRAPAWHGYRVCEQPATIGWQPKSTFQVGGAGAVGTGSLRGFATLLALRRAGFSIWPFHAPAFPCVVEIYPRTFTGAVRKSSAVDRAAYLRKHLPDPLSSETFAQAAASEDAFDALCSVIGMERQRNDCLSLAQATDPGRLLEGDIFPGRPISLLKP